MISSVRMKSISPAVACLLLSATAIHAHHSFTAEFDINRPVRLEGILTKLEFANPHTHLYLEVNGTAWVIEAASPNGLLRRGFGKSTVTEGTRVVVDAYQSKTSPHQAAARDIVIPGGYIFLLGSFSEGVK